MTVNVFVFIGVGLPVPVDSVGYRIAETYTAAGEILLGGRNETVTAQSHSHDVGRTNWRRAGCEAYVATSGGTSSASPGGRWAFSIPDLAKARQIRIAGAGHPIEWGERRGDPASTFIVQHSVSSRGCQLMVVNHDGSTEWQHVSLKALIEAQHAALSEQCRVAVAELEADDEAHRMKYQSNQLRSIFAAYDYWTAKIRAGRPR